MIRVTVVWHPQAIAELARIWEHDASRPDITAAAHEIDELLKVDPHRKGNGHALARLDRHVIELVRMRTTALPEDLRRMQLGPLDVLFTVHIEDRIARVLQVRTR